MKWRRDVSIKSFYNKGLTFIELMTVLAVVSVMFATSAPNMIDFVLNNRAATQVNELQSSLTLARNEAIKRNSNITVCQSSNGTDCIGNWQNGWIVFIDNDIDGNVDAGEKILRVYGERPEGNTLASSQEHVIYAKNGIARSGSNGTFRFCDARGAESLKGIVVGPSGRPRVATENDIRGFLENADETTLACS
jgi:type IV fimbrial biogenesis protein FimT